MSLVGISGSLHRMLGNSTLKSVVQHNSKIDLIVEVISLQFSRYSKNRCMETYLVLLTVYSNLERQAGISSSQ